MEIAWASGLAALQAAIEDWFLGSDVEFLGDGPLAKVMVYQSPSIVERRRRILRETRAIISELGYENFSVRELSRRAGVAQRTLYNAYGSLENIVITAILQYYRDFQDTAGYRYGAHSVIGRIERLIKTHSRNLQIRPYTTAVMAVYNGPNTERAIRDAIRRTFAEKTLPLAAHLAASGQLAEHVSKDGYIETAATLTYSTLSSWCVGEIADDAMVESIVETFLLVTYASTRGAAQEDASAWLTQLRSRSAAWIQLRAESAVPDRPRRAARRPAGTGLPDSGS